MGEAIGWWLDTCGSHPGFDDIENGPSHECMLSERRCVYCGISLQPYGCHGCGQWLSARDMHHNETRCTECR
jgi:hypothetical protein